MLEKLMQVQELLWRDSDSIEKQDLWSAQEIIMEMSLHLAVDEGKEQLLYNRFPELYGFGG